MTKFAQSIPRISRLAFFRFPNKLSFQKQVAIAVAMIVVVMGMCRILPAFTAYAPYPDLPLPPASSTGGQGTVNALFAKQKALHASTDVDEFVRRNQLPYVTIQPYYVDDVLYLKKAEDSFQLSSNAISRLMNSGFIVVPADREPTSYGQGHGSIYYSIYESDLPVLVTADAIFHAFHRSFDKLMQHAEETLLLPKLQYLIAGAMTRLNPDIPEERDAMVYLAVPWLLLEKVDPYNESGVTAADIPDDVRIDADGYVQLIYGEASAPIDFFGKSEEVDFSIFYPRGHYGESFELQQYFRAMVWLNRMPVSVWSSDAAQRNARHEHLVNALIHALDNSKNRSLVKAIDRFYAQLIGSDKSIGPMAILQSCHRGGFAGCPRDHREMKRIVGQLARQHIRQTGTENTETLQLKFFPTKFGYTAWITEQTTQPRLMPQSPESGRFMASPFDVAYALGASRAVHWLNDELRSDIGISLAGTLDAARITMQRIPPESVDDTPYNHWLKALMHASAPTVGKGYPQVMRTALWHDHKLETVLSSWTEMRHDTLLMIESSGASGCDFPLAYVEPLPAVYRSLRIAIKKMQHLYTGLDSTLMAETATFFDHFANTLSRLELISRDEPGGRTMTASDLRFINGMMTAESDEYTGERLYNGWYPRLYWTPYFEMNAFSAESGTDEPLVADVHTDYVYEQVLEVATGHPGILFVVMSINGKTALYAGAASSFYFFEQAAEDRMNDADWRRQLAEKPPQHPAFANAYWVSEPLPPTTSE